MTRKRYIKLLMSNGLGRNDANSYAILAQHTGKSYHTAYMECPKGLKATIDEAADAIQAIANAAVRVGIALTKAAAAFVEEYRVEMEKL